MTYAKLYTNFPFCICSTYVSQASIFNFQVLQKMSIPLQSLITSWREIIYLFVYRTYIKIRLKLPLRLDAVIHSKKLIHWFHRWNRCCQEQFVCTPCNLWDILGDLFALQHHLVILAHIHMYRTCFFSERRNEEKRTSKARTNR